MEHTGDDDDLARTAGAFIQRHVAALRTIAGQLEQVAVLLPALGRDVQLGLLGEAYRIAREAGDALHDLARTINDLYREE